MRTFIAIELPDETKESISHIQDRLRPSQADVKWVEPHNIHLTLKFLGEIDEKKLDKINSLMEDVAKDKNSFQMRISCLGAFPHIKSPRVIWVGIDKGDAETKEIAEELEEGIAKIGIPKEKKSFSSHITIGRLRSPLRRDKLIQDLLAMTDNFKLQNSEFEVTKITLLKSTLTPKGPIYEILKETSLKAN